ncbi:MAG: carbamoyltransferase HypF [Acidobacteria bacterium]|nr:carbamoyltransferase HypF [Acidobacteriota bacterium]
MAENEISPPVLGIAWDGTGYGTDGTIWGGEFLTINETSFERVAHLRPFRLPGGEKAVREPRRTALGLLYEVLGEKVFERRDLFPVVSFSEAEVATIKKMLANSINAPVTSSAGRLFDAVASILGLRECVAFEGQAAMELEFHAAEAVSGNYDFDLIDDVLDWEPMLRQLISDIDSGGRPAAISAKFHNTLVEMMVAVAKKVDLERVALSGGCFQNRYLLEHAVERLTADGFRVYWHQRIPTNDGGISLGQIAAAARENSQQRRKASVCA